MTTRAMGPLAGIGWLKNGINLGRHNPKAVFGGAVLMLLIAMLPTAITVPVQLMVKPGVAGIAGFMSFSLVASLLMVPLMGGYLRLIDAAESGRPARARDVFGAYRRGGGAWQLIGFGLAMLALYVVAVAAVVAVVGTGIVSWYMQVAAGSAHGADAAAMQLPDGLGLAVALGSVLWLLMSGVFAIGFGQVSLGRSSALAALGDGMLGTVKNLLPLLVLTLVGMVAMLLLGVGLMLVALLLGVVAKLVGTWLLVAIAVPLYIALLLVLYVVMFGVIYHLWRDVCGGGDAVLEPVDALTA